MELVSSPWWHVLGMVPDGKPQGRKGLQPQPVPLTPFLNYSFLYVLWLPVSPWFLAFYLSILAHSPSQFLQGLSTLGLKIVRKGEKQTISYKTPTPCQGLCCPSTCTELFKPSAYGRKKWISKRPVAHDHRAPKIGFDPGYAPFTLLSFSSSGTNLGFFQETFIRKLKGQTKDEGQSDGSYEKCPWILV